MSGCTVPLVNFELAGAKDPVIVPQGTHTTLILDFKMGVGTITLSVNSTADYLAYIENEVSIREGSGGTLEAAEEVSYTAQNAETIKVEFDSQDEEIVTNYQYVIKIKVKNNITLEINFLDSTGEISTSISDTTINIASLDIETSTGPIGLTLENVHFSDSSPIIASSTGSHDITLLNLNYSTSTSWTISTSTGNIDLDLADTLTPGSISRNHLFDISGSTGNIMINADLHQDFGLKIDTSISIGEATIPGGGDSFTSTNFATANQKYDFDLSVSTGDITFSEG